MYSAIALSNDQLHARAPSVFAEREHASRSARYSFIPTARIVDSLRSEGFLPVAVTTSRVRDAGKRGFEKHMLRFRRDGQFARVGDTLPEVVLVNSHDGSSSYQLSAGLYRLVCSNGLCIPQGTIDSVRVKHSGADIVQEVIEGSFRVLSQANIGIETADRWRAITLSDGEQQALAIGAHHARFADADGNVTTPIQPAQLLAPRRYEDRANDLWTTFNRIQENTIKGGLHGTGLGSNGRRRRVTTREVKGIDGNINLNKALWKMAEHLASAKTGTVLALAS